MWMRRHTRGPMACLTVALLTVGCETNEGPSKAKAATAPKAQLSLEADANGISEQIAALRKGGKTKVRYVAPGHGEAERYAEWVTEAALAALTGSAAPAAPDGFALQVFDEGALWLLHEDPQRRRGAGAILLRVGDARPLLVEAPHTFFDEGTLPLSLYAFEQVKARALVLNTAHRGNVAQGMSDEEFEEASRSAGLASDVAHAERSFFQSAHLALCRTLPEPAVVQLHGYRDGYIPADAVVSSAGGHLDASPIVKTMRELLPTSGIALHGLDTKRMGGTTNVQAKDARKHEVPFLHLEMSHQLRTRLREDTALLDQVLDAITKAAGV